ncbi:MAG: DUF1292 domain-containing protein [Lachnospiraceae bacterium]
MAKKNNRMRTEQKKVRPGDQEGEFVAELTPEEEELMGVIWLVGEDGTRVPFELLDYLTFQDQTYFVMTPKKKADEKKDEETGYLIMKVETRGEEVVSYDLVKDEVLLQKIFHQFKKSHKELFPEETLS